MWRTFSNASWYLQLLHPFKCTVYAPCSLEERAGCSINSIFVGERGRGGGGRRNVQRRQREEWKGDGRGGGEEKGKYLKKSFTANFHLQT